MKNIIVLSIVTGVLLISTSNASARELDLSMGAYMTDEGNTVEKDVFGWDETPFMFMQFDVDDLNVKRSLHLNWVWWQDGEWPVSLEFDKLTDFSGDSLNIWQAPKNWDNHREIGEWNVRATWWNPSFCSDKGGWGTSKVNFTVTPEPLSSILFLIGGTALVARRYLKRKKKVLKILPTL